MARAWAMEWRTGRDHPKYSLHINKSDISKFAAIYNSGKPEEEQLTPFHSAWQPNVAIEMFQHIADSGYGLVVRWRP